MSMAISADLVVDGLLQAVLIVDDAQQVECGRACEARDKLSRQLTLVLVVDDEGNMLQFKGCRIAKHEKLNNRWADEDGAASGIAQQSEQFLDGKRKYAFGGSNASVQPLVKPQ